MTTHSSFTPSLSDRETLENLFVAREDLARGILDGIRESATSGNKHQRLLIGPRGIGKTHLVALIYHRVRADPDLAARLRIAWLPEDPYITGYATLLTLILRQLRRDEAGLDWLDGRLDAVLDRDDTVQQEAMLEQLLLDCLDGRTLLLIVENLDDLLDALREEGQRKLRALIQNHGRITILATSTSLIGAVTDRDKTFYGFFRTHTLTPFGVEEAASLLSRLAQHGGDQTLADLIWSPLGLARVRATHYLAGGNPRVYVIFFEFLTCESLDDLVAPFMGLLDKLTPYYQARMSHLAPLQRSIIDGLRRLRCAAPVKEIARQAMASSQTVSAQLGKLVDLGFVIRADSLGRSTYYELREPLMRLCLEVKESRGQTVGLFVQFLRVWYSRAELDGLAGGGRAGGLERAHLREAAALASIEPDPLRPSMDRAYFEYQAAGDWQHALTEVDCAIEREPGDKECWERKARCLDALGRPLEERLVCWRRVAELDPADYLAWNQQDVILWDLGRDDAALLASAKAVELKPDDPVLNRNHSWNLWGARRYAEAREYLQRAMDLAGEPTSAADWHQRGEDLESMDRQDEALQAYRRSLEIDPHRMETWNHLLGGLKEQGRHRLLQRMAERAVSMMPQEASLYAYLGTASHHLGQFEAASVSYERALAADRQLDGKGVPATFWQAANLCDMGRYNDALRLLERPQPGYSRPHEFQRALAHSDTLMWLDRWDEGVAAVGQLLMRSGPLAWSGIELWITYSLILRTHNPQIWRRFITVWLDLFGRYGRLAELGEALVWSIRRLAIDWITDQTADAWLATWRDLTGSIDEFALPLRLLATGVAYKKTRDPRTLLDLPREERGLLAPWLVNLFAETPDDLDREMDALLRTIEQRFAAEQP